MKKFLFATCALALAFAAQAEEFTRIVKPIPAETNAVVGVSFRGAVAPVAFRILGDAGTNATVKADLVSYTAGYRTVTPLVASTNVAGAAVSISASGFDKTAYPGDQVVLTIANPRKETGAVVVYGKR